MTKSKITKTPKQGKKETEESFARRMERDVQEEMHKKTLVKKSVVSWCLFAIVSNRFANDLK